MASADSLANTIALGVVASLKELTDTLSGDDSGLTNAWEEVCVQVQGEESVDWETYREIINEFVRAELEALPYRDRAALWLHTDDGYSWHSDNSRLEQDFIDVDRSADAGEKGRPEIAVRKTADELSTSEEIDAFLGDLFGDSLGDAAPPYSRTKPVSPQLTPIAPITAGEAGASAIKNVGMSLADVAKGLNALFKPKPGTLGNVTEGGLLTGQKSEPEISVQGIFDEPADEVEAAYVPYDFSAIVEYILERHLRPMAETFSNRRIEAYLSDESSDEEEEEEEEYPGASEDKFIADEFALPLSSADSQKTGVDRLSDKIILTLDGMGVDRFVGVAALKDFLRSLHEVFTKAGHDQVNLLSQVQTIFGSTPAHHLGRIICADLISVKSYPSGQSCPLQYAVEALCRERGIAGERGNAIISSFLKALAEVCNDGYGRCESPMFITYQTIGGEAAFHLGGLFVGDDGDEVWTEMQYLDHRLNRFGKMIELWKMELAWDKEDRE